MSSMLRPGSVPVQGMVNSGSIQIKKLMGLSPAILNAREVPEIIRHLIETEEIYCSRVLETIVVDFKRRLDACVLMKQPVLSERKINTLFQGISELWDLSAEAVSLLGETRYRNSFVFDFYALFHALIPFLKIYADYIHSHSKRIEFLHECLDRKKKFQKFIEFNEKALDINLEQLLSIPLIRLQHYLVYFDVIQKKTNESDATYEIVGSIVERLNEVMYSISHKRVDEIARKRVAVIQNEVFKGRVNICLPSRFVIKDSLLLHQLQKSGSSTPGRILVHFVLFNDFLLFGNPEKRYIRVIRLNTMSVHGLSYEGHEKSFSISCRIGTLQFFTRTAAEKMLWVSLLQKAIHNAPQFTMGQENVNEDSFEKMILKKRKMTDITQGNVRKLNITNGVYRKCQENMKPTVSSFSFTTVESTSNSTDIPLNERSENKEVVPPPPPMKEAEYIPPPPPIEDIVYEEQYYDGHYQYDPQVYNEQAYFDDQSTAGAYQEQYYVDENGQMFPYSSDDYATFSSHDDQFEEQYVPRFQPKPRAFQSIRKGKKVASKKVFNTSFEKAIEAQVHSVQNSLAARLASIRSNAMLDEDSDQSHYS